MNFYDSKQQDIRIYKKKPEGEYLPPSWWPSQAKKDACFMEYLSGYMLIFFARICDVSLSTVRTLMVVQGRKFHAATIGFFEIIIYIAALGKVVSGLDDPGNLLAYALGFASGNYAGIFIEEKIALGNFTAQVVLKEKTWTN